MIKRFLVPFVVAPLLFTAISASAAFLDVTTDPNFTYTPDPATKILYFDGKITPQNPDYIQTLVESEFEVIGSLTYVSACDGGGCDNASGLDGDSFDSNDPFNYLAIHFGNGELFFYWAAPITSFSIAGYEDIFTKGGGLSNYRVFNCELSRSYKRWFGRSRRWFK